MSGQTTDELEQLLNNLDSGPLEGPLAEVPVEQRISTVRELRAQNVNQLLSFVESARAFKKLEFDDDARRQIQHAQVTLRLIKVYDERIAELGATVTIQ